jgi:hypothetical protein
MEKLSYNFGIKSIIPKGTMKQIGGVTCKTKIE